jgi:hypothetical protein
MEVVQGPNRGCSAIRNKRGEVDKRGDVDVIWNAGNARYLLKILTCSEGAIKVSGTGTDLGRKMILVTQLLPSP